jgi:hypothetical protein
MCLGEKDIKMMVRSKINRHSEADFFSEPWMYRLKESSPYSGSTSLRHFLNLDLCIPLY